MIKKMCIMQLMDYTATLSNKKASNGNAGWQWSFVVINISIFSADLRVMF